jgi:hypothetical protein
MINPVSAKSYDIVQFVNQYVSAIAHIFNSAIQFLFRQIFRPEPGFRFYRNSFYQEFQSLMQSKFIDTSTVFSEELKLAAKKFIQKADKSNYENFTKALRQDLIKEPENKDLQDLCCTIYKQNLFPSYQRLLENELKIKNLDQVKSFSKEKFLGFLDSHYNFLANGWFYNNHLGPKYYDPRLEGDLPSHLYYLNFKDQSVEVIRTPNATFDDHHLGKTVSTVVPEFESLLKSGKTHLYINLMVSSWGSEKRRTEALATLADKFPNFVFCSLDKDTSFYSQSKSFADVSEAQLFKKSFINRMIENENFIFPKNIDVKSQFSPILEQIHQEFFSGKTSLSVQERKVFIELCYSKIIEILCVSSQAETLNISCKSTVDRGASQLAMLHAFHNRGNKELIDKKLLSILAFGPALGNQNRAMLPERFSSMIASLKHLI